MPKTWGKSGPKNIYTRSNSRRPKSVKFPLQALNKKEKGGGLGSPGGEDSEHEQVL